MSFAERSLEYCKQALSDTLPHRKASKLEKLACARHLRDLERQDDTDFPYYFDEAAGNRHCKFMELLPHTKGLWKGTLLVLEPHQIFIHHSIFAWRKKSTGYRRFTKVYLELPRKNGKALCLNTLVPTPEGWTTQGELKAGDRVFDEQGNACNVTDVTEVMNERPCYEVTFSNGEKVIADENHDWLTTARVNMIGERKERKIRRFRMPKLKQCKCGSKTKLYWYAQLYGRDKYIGDTLKMSEAEATLIFNELAEADLKEFPFGEDNLTRIRTTKEIFESLTYGARNDFNHTIQMPGAIKTEEIELPIAPYTLGSWLGDGNSNGPSLSCGDEDVQHFINEVESEGYDVKIRKDRTAWRLLISSICEFTGNVVNCSRVENMTKVLRQVGVLNNKHIPEIYLRASFEQRLSLLQGLMDTDGTVNIKGDVFQYVSISKKLADSFCDLLSTMGIKYSIVGKKMRCNGVDVKGTCYSVQFNVFKCEMPVFRLQRKLARMRNKSDLKMNPRSRTTSIVGCELVKSVPVKCISVDSPSHLYLFGKTMLPTHNSLTAAGVALYLAFVDGEKGAEVYCGATVLAQAMAVFEPCWQMCNLSPDFMEAYGITLAGTAKNPTSVYRISDMSRCEPVIGKPGDGANVSAAIIDEYHEHPDAGLLGTMITGTGSRPQPVIFIITTAGFDTSYPCFEEHLESVKILEGTLEKENVFTMIFGVDVDDDWTNWESWTKANPNYGISILPDSLKETYSTALNSLKDRNTLLCKHLNIWCNSSQAWMDMQKWDACKDESLKLEDFEGQECWIGVDLASKIDLTAVMLLFRAKDGKIATFGFYYLPSETIEKSENTHYQLWVAEGILTKTEGARTDFKRIEDDIRDLAKRFIIKELLFDEKEAAYWIQNLQEDSNFECIAVPQSPAYISEPMKTLEALIYAQEFIHSNDKLLNWSMSNVVKKQSKSGGATKSYYPTKQTVANKIDPVVAIITALSRMMTYEDNGDSYNTRAAKGEEEILRVL